jgi:hypothetical protein
MSHLSIFSTKEIPAVIAAIVFAALLVSSASAFAQIRPTHSSESSMTTAKTVMASIYLISFIQSYT